MSTKRYFFAISVLFALILGSFPVFAQDGPVTITWFVGLGAGGQPEQIAAQNAVVEAFNASQDDIVLEIIIVDNNVAQDTLGTLIATGDAPDIVGPVGLAGSNAFAGNWLDLEPLVESSGFDLSRYDEAAVDSYRTDEGLVGLPFATFPSFIYYRRDLFDESGIPYPPSAYGEPYADGDEWTMDKLREIGMLLTLDENGYNATEEEFNPDAIIQWGFVSQWTDPRGHASLFGAANPIDEDGNAYVPDSWRAAFDWFYKGIWEDHFIPNGAQAGSDILANGNAFASGNVAMAHTHLWYTCCLGDVTDNWDIAPVPSYNGVTTAKLHGDTFRILNSTEHPEEAFEVLTYLIAGDAAPQLLQVYGGMPALPELQEDFFATLDETYPQGVNWQVAIDSLAYADSPNHESYLPNFRRVTDRIGEFQVLYENTPGLDIQAELDALIADLQVLYETADEESSDVDTGVGSGS